MAKVWLVDDEPGVLSILAMAIERTLAVEVRTYSYATEFLHDCKDSNGVLVLDYNLPDLRGDEVVGILARTSRKIPTLLISGDPAIEEAWHIANKEPEESLVQQIFIKPFRTQDLLTAEAV